MRTIPVMRRLPGCQFGPVELRRVLRLAREPGERLIGWAPARVPMPAWQHLWLAAASMAPGAHGLAAVAIARSRRMVVLTDRRLFVLGVDRGVAKGKAKSVRAIVDIGALRVVTPPATRKRRWVPTTIRVHWAGDLRDETLLLDFAAKAKGPPVRLRDALSVLSSEADRSEDVLQEPERSA